MSTDAKYDALCKLTEGNYKAFLYDCDGTLADNMQAHKDTYVLVAAEDGVNIDSAIIDELSGFPITEVVKEINKRYNTHFDPEKFEGRKSDLFYNQFVGQTVPIEFVVQHLVTHAGHQRIGVVSGGSRKTVERTLEVLGIDQLVEVLVCAGETPQGKPFPDPFLFAAEKLGVEPGACMVFEDGDAGVRAAAAAGMKSIRIDKVQG